MKFQQKLIATAAKLRTRGRLMSSAAVASLSVLTEVARRHGARLVRENRAIARDAGKDLGALARSAFATFAAQRATPRRARRKSARKRKTPTAH